MSASGVDSIPKASPQSQALSSSSPQSPVQPSNPHQPAIDSNNNLQSVQGNFKNLNVGGQVGSHGLPYGGRYTPSGVFMSNTTAGPPSVNIPVHAPPTGLTGPPASKKRKLTEAEKEARERERAEREKAKEREKAEKEKEKAAKVWRPRIRPCCV